MVARSVCARVRVRVCVRERVNICDTGAQNPSLVDFVFFYSVIFYIASASKYILQNQNILFLTEVILDWIEQSKKWKKSNKKFKNFHVIIIICNNYFIIMKLFWVIKGFILYNAKQTALKSGNNFTTYGKFTDPI